MKIRHLFMYGTLILLLSVFLSACATVSNLEQLSNNILDESIIEEISSLISEVENPDKINQDETISLAPTNDPSVIAAYQNTLEEIYTRVNPQVVNINVLVESSDLISALPGMPELPFEHPQIPGMPGDDQTPEDNAPFYSQGLGSGFIWNKDGYIVTNNHVVDNAAKINVTFHDGTTVPAELIGTDADSDLAVLKVEVDSDLLNPVDLADQDSINVGQMAIAIGNPFGLDGTMTVGIVSALGRSLPVTDGVQNGPRYSIPEIIQTDAPINPGNSGGVLLNAKGELIGVTAAIESPVMANAGIGYAIPVSIVEKVIPVLIEEGSFPNPYLGISGMNLTQDLAQAMGLEPSQRGALVSEVLPGGPAEKAGIQGSTEEIQINNQPFLLGGDVITAIDQQEIKDMEDLIAYLATQGEVGKTITLSILRDGEQVEIDVVLGARPGADVAKKDLETTKPSLYIGIFGMDLIPELAEQLELDEGQTGVLVIDVEPNSPAEEGGITGGTEPYEIDGQEILLGGDIIIGFDGQTVDDITTLQNLISNSEAGQEVDLNILRNGKEMVITLVIAER